MDEYDIKYKYFDELQTKHKFQSIWSVYNIKGIREKAFTDNTPLELIYDMHWGEKTVRTRVPKNPTWLTLWKCADKLIYESGDRHHIFIEAFLRNGNILTLVTGS